jgi:hypothetical protein
VVQTDVHVLGRPAAAEPAAVVAHPDVDGELVVPAGERVIEILGELGIEVDGRGIG